MSEELTPDEWRRHKGERTPLTDEHQREKLEEIILTSKQVLIEAQREFREYYGTDYDIQGIIIFGSWADKAAAEESDLDIATLSDGDPADLRDDIADRIGKKSGMKVENSFGMNFDLRDDDSLRDLIAGRNEDIKGNFIIVTPFEHVQLRIDELKDSL